MNNLKIQIIIISIIIISGCETLPENYDISRGYDQVIDKQIAEAYKDLYNFETESPLNCNSVYLDNAVAFVTALDNVINTIIKENRSMASEITFDWNKANARITLDIAESAASKHCFQRAKILYKYVIQKYTGLGFLAYRQRAIIGLNEIKINF